MERAAWEHPPSELLQRWGCSKPRKRLPLLLLLLLPLLGLLLQAFRAQSSARSCACIDCADDGFRHCGGGHFNRHEAGGSQLDEDALHQQQGAQGTQGSTHKPMHGCAPSC